MISPDELVSRAETDGYFVVPGYFAPELARAARAELVEILDRDLARREAEGLRKRHREGERMVSVRNRLMHTVYFPLWESERLREMADRVFGDEILGEFTRRVIGEHFRLRVDLVRRSPGVDDSVDSFQIPHPWHRDTPGEFTFGMFFDDLTRPNSGGTAVIPGSHWKPQHPLWEFALSKDNPVSKRHFVDKLEPESLDPRLYRWMIGNRMMRRRLRPRATEIRGKPGDLYFFINDLWHGRAANVHGGRNIMVRIGGFASEFDFKDDVGLPSDLDVLPESVRRHYRADQPANTDPDTVLRRIQRRQRPQPLERVAAIEKALAARMTERRYEARGASSQ